MAEPTEGPLPGEDGFDELITGAETCLTAVVSDFDFARKQMYEQLSELARNFAPVMYSGQTYTIDIDSISDPFEALLRAVLENSKDVDTDVRLIVDAFKDDSDERVDMMNSLIKCENGCIEYYDPDYLEGKIRQLLLTDEPIEELAAYYALDIRTDCDNFMQHLLEEFRTDHVKHAHNEEDSDDYEIVSVRKEVRDHVFDVAKVAVGTLVALAMDRAWQRRRGR